MKKLLFILAAVALCRQSPYPPQRRPPGRRPKEDQEEGAHRFANQYIVVSQDWAARARGDASFAPDVARDMASIAGGKIKHVYKHALQGFTTETVARGGRALWPPTRA